MKVKLANKKIDIISNMKQATLNPQDLTEAVAKLRNMVIK